MERSISSLTFNGSISEAILEAKRQRKLFVVYVSGEDAESVRLEKSTWTDKNVVESLSKYCILLHISEGSPDLAFFSAIYPQKSVPCITVIGYNGVQLWQNDGFVSADILAPSLERLWLSLHIQETTATVLTAAIASKKSDPPTTSGASDVASLEQGSSSTNVPSPSMEKHSQSAEARPAVTSKYQEENEGSKGKEINKERGEPSSRVNANELTSGKDEMAAKVVVDPKTKNLDKSGVMDNDSLSVDDGSPGPIENNNVTDSHSEILERDSQMITESNEAVLDKMPEAVEVKKGDALDSSKRSSDVHFNIRLPNGASLQEKFPVTSTLRMVKDYVDKNQISSIGSYDLALPYPRKVFNNQDLSKSLLELELLNRQALIVVPHQQAPNHHLSRDQSNSTVDTDSGNGGYFGYVRWIMSYMNPFSYLGGSSTNSSSSGHESQDRLWQYRPGPALGNTRPGTGTRNLPDRSTSPESSRNEKKSGKPSTSRFGSNIHTLKHDEDDRRFGDRNAFWNGNSTEYGGDNDSK